MNGSMAAGPVAIGSTVADEAQAAAQGHCVTPPVADCPVCGAQVTARASGIEQTVWPVPAWLWECGVFDGGERHWRCWRARAEAE